MTLDPTSTTSTAILLLLECTLYFAYVQLVKHDRRRNRFFIFLLALHIGHRLVVLDIQEHSSFFFGWALQRFDFLQTIDGTQSTPDLHWEAASPPPWTLVGAFNVTNAIQLHNKLVEHVLIRAPQFSDRVQKNWTSLYTNADFGLSAPDIRPRLTEPVMEFLSGIYAWTELESFSLTPHVRGVAWPEFLSPVPESPEGELFYDSFPGCIVLYHSNVADSDARGLVLDQRTFSARVMPSIWDNEKGHYWAPLEDILAAWLAEAEVGRWTIDLTREGGDIYGPPTAWRQQRWIQSDIDRTLVLWEAYLALIAAKQGIADRSSSPAPFASDSTLEQARVEGFERDLLSRMRRPSLTFVAPGLRIPDEAMFSSILLEASRRREASVIENDEDERFADYATLLFYADEPVAKRSYHPRDETHTAPYWISKFILEDRCGVYLGTWHSAQYADAVSLVAPRKDDGDAQVLFAQYSGVVGSTLLKPGVEYLADAAGSYQPMRLYHMIARWYDLVVTGRWTVGPDGVQGDIEQLWGMMPHDWKY